MYFWLIDFSTSYEPGLSLTVRFDLPDNLTEKKFIFFFCKILFFRLFDLTASSIVPRTPYSLSLPTSCHNAWSQLNCGVFDFLLPRYATIGSKNMSHQWWLIMVIHQSIFKFWICWLHKALLHGHHALSMQNRFFEKFKFLFRNRTFLLFCAEPKMRSCCMQWISPFVYSMTWKMSHSYDSKLCDITPSPGLMVLQSHEATLVMWL